MKTIVKGEYFLKNCNGSGGKTVCPGRLSWQFKQVCCPYSPILILSHITFAALSTTTKQRKYVPHGLAQPLPKMRGSVKRISATIVFLPPIRPFTHLSVVPTVNVYILQYNAMQSGSDKFLLFCMYVNKGFLTMFLGAKLEKEIETKGLWKVKMESNLFLRFWCLL